MHLAFPAHLNLLDLVTIKYLVECKLQTSSFYFFFLESLVISFPTGTHIFLSIPPPHHPSSVTVRPKVLLAHTTSYKAGVLYIQKCILSRNWKREYCDTNVIKQAKN